MNWRAEARKDLQSYPQRKASVQNIKEKIKILEEQMISLKGVAADEPVMGGMSKQEERLLDNITERERLGFSLKITEELIKLTEQGLTTLDDRERQVLEGFYMQRTDNHVEKLCEKMHIEKTRLYEIKDNALKKFTIAMYGTVEI